jgi:hypothetical protein
VLAAVPYWRRTEKMGFPPGAVKDRKNKKKASDSVEMGTPLESSAAEEKLTYEKMQAQLNQQISQMQAQLNQISQKRGTRRTTSQGRPIDLVVTPWQRAVEQHEYVKHWKGYVGDDSCPLHTVYCNIKESRAQQLKLGKEVCPCIGGYNMETGEMEHEDFTAQATPSQRRKIYKDLKALEDAKEEACKGVAGEKLREIRVACTTKKREYKLNLFKHWQERKHAAQISSEAVQVQEEAQSRAYQEEETEEDDEESGGTGLSSIEEVEEDEDVDEERERLRSEIDSVEQKEEKDKSGETEETHHWVDGEPSPEVASVDRLETAKGGEPRLKGLHIWIPNTSTQRERLMVMANKFRNEYSVERSAELSFTRADLSRCQAAKLVSDEMDGFGVYSTHEWCIAAAEAISRMRTRVHDPSLTAIEVDRDYSDTSSEWEGPPPEAQSDYSPVTEDEDSWSPKPGPAATRGGLAHAAKVDGRDLAHEMMKAECKESAVFEGVGCIEERDQLCVAAAAGALEEHVAALDEEERIRAASLDEAAVIFEANEVLASRTVKAWREQALSRREWQW